MIEKFKTNAEVIENGDKYLYGNHVRMPLSLSLIHIYTLYGKGGMRWTRR